MSDRIHTRYSVEEWHLAEFLWLNTPNGSINGAEFNELSGSQQGRYIVAARNYLQRAADRHVGVTKVEKTEWEAVVTAFAGPEGSTEGEKHAYGAGLLAGLIPEGSDVSFRAVRHIEEKQICVAVAIMKK